jgi:hypothetical protein
MARPWEAVQGIQVRHEACAERVEVVIANKLKEIGVLITDKRLVAILEKVAGAVVAQVEGDGIAGEEPAHEC